MGHLKISLALVWHFLLNFSFSQDMEVFNETLNSTFPFTFNSTIAPNVEQVNLSLLTNNTELIFEFERAFQESLDDELPGSNCTPSFIDEFPSDGFTSSQRRQGWIIIHCLICLYVFYAFAIVCGDYFVPSVQELSHDLKLESDIAGATIMGIATSSPELFTSIVATFIMRGDIGVGTVVGSAVFNHLGVCAFIGFGCSKVVPLNWWPVTRDVVFYGISVAALFIILLDCKIFWYESASLILLYFLYIYGMYHDATLHSWTEALLKWEPSYSLSGRKRKYRITQQRRKSRFLGVNEENCASSTTIVTISNGYAFTIGDDALMKPTDIPKTSRVMPWVGWILSWPIRAVMSITIPHCRSEDDGRNRFYLLTFIMSTLWIAGLSYVAAWMMTIVAHTLRIPDTAFGVSIIAVGTSVPEAVSSIIVAQKGYGTMAVSNAVGSNTFNILVCLGVPWLIQSLVNMNVRVNYAEISSPALEYSTGMLIVSLGIMYGMVVWNGMKIDKKMAGIAFFLYVCFLAFDLLVEMNVFVLINLPIC